MTVLHTSPYKQIFKTHQSVGAKRPYNAQGDGFPFADKNESNQMPPKVQSGQQIKTHQLCFLKLFDNNLFSVRNLLQKREKISDLHTCIYEGFRGLNDRPKT